MISIPIDELNFLSIGIQKYQVFLSIVFLTSMTKAIPIKSNPPT